tara:strand:+ start:1414 stop:2169 length:756 start_codon:yes stop_codon:yes gene_type:complete
MFNNKVIEFHYPKAASKFLEDNLPEPISKIIPDWYKELKHTLERKTVKGCVPFMDTLISGYVLKMPQDMFINHNFYDKEKKAYDSVYSFAYGAETNYLDNNYINLNTTKTDAHPKEQLGDKCPFHEKNKNLPYYKIVNPFVIKTPPGYSCLFVPPLNNSDDRFNIIPGIVDTDSYVNEINFPIVINGDKYSNLKTVIKRGTPYVQVIPFKRDDWQMKTVSYEGHNKQNKFLNVKSIINNYKKYIWKKKKWS